MNSRIISATKRMNTRVKLLGLENTENHARLYSFLTSRILLIVKITLSVSPEKRLDLLAPSFTSSPLPSEILSSIIWTCLGLEHCIIRLSFSFSIHLNAVMSSLLPCRIPAWLAPVCEDRSVSHCLRIWVLSSIIDLTVGISPLSMASHSTSWASPSISTIIRPG